MTFQIRQDLFPKRCEICHQADQFDPVRAFCVRCAGLAEGNLPPAQERFSAKPKTPNRFFLFLSNENNNPWISISKGVCGGMLALVCWFGFAILFPVWISGTSVNLWWQYQKDSSRHQVTLTQVRKEQIYILNLQTGKELLQKPDEMYPIYPCFQGLHGFEGNLFSADSQQVLATSSAEVEVWNLNPPELKLTLYEPSGSSFDAPTFSPDQSKIAAIVGPEIRLWNAGTGKEFLSVRREQLSTKPARGFDECNLAFSPDSRFLACATAGEIFVLDLAPNPVPPQLFSCPDTASIRSLEFSPDGTTLLAMRKATSGTFCEAVLFDVESRQPIRRYLAGERACNATFSPDGKAILIGGTAARIVDRATGATVRIFADRPNYSGGIAVAYAADGTQILTGNDNSLVLWDANTGQEVKRIIGHYEMDFKNVKFSPDGKLAVAVSWRR